MAYHQENILQAGKTQQILVEVNTLTSNIVKALEENNKENLQPPLIKVSNNASSAPDYVLLLLAQSLAAPTKEFQSLKNHKIITPNTPSTLMN